MAREKNPCPLCGGTRRVVLIRKENWFVYRCSSCGLGFLDPRPSDLEMSTLYDEMYFADQYDRGVDPDTPDFRKRLRLEGHRIRFFRGLKGKGSVLDIGCGNGYFLAACRERGYRVTGLDLSEWVITYVKETLGIKALSGHLDRIDLPGQVFDVVTLWHVLEHTGDPRKAIIKAGCWLKEEGVLVLEVPNYEGTDAQKMWNSWSGWSLPYHLYHFTSDTLVSMLEKHGFKIIRTKDYHSDYIKEKLKWIPVISLFARLIAKRYSGTSFAVVAKKDRL